MSLFIKDNELLEKYNKIKSATVKGFDSEPVYKERNIKSKIKSYEGKINTNFHDNKVYSRSSVRLSVHFRVYLV